MKILSIFPFHFWPSGSGSGSAICMRIRIRQLKLMRIRIRIRNPGFQKLKTFPASVTCGFMNYGFMNSLSTYVRNLTCAPQHESIGNRLEFSPAKFDTPGLINLRFQVSSKHSTTKPNHSSKWSWLKTGNPRSNFVQIYRKKITSCSMFIPIFPYRTSKL